MNRAYAQRLTRLEALYKCPRHDQWLQCGCEVPDPDRLTVAELELVDRLLEKSRYTPILSATPCLRCGEAMICVPCQTPAWSVACERLGPDEQRLLADLLTKALVRPSQPAAGTKR